MKEALPTTFFNWFDNANKPNVLVGKAATSESTKSELVDMFDKQRSVFLMECKELHDSLDITSNQPHNAHIDALCDIYVTLSGLLQIRQYASELPVDLEAHFDTAYVGVYQLHASFYEDHQDKMVNLSLTSPISDFICMLYSCGLEIMLHTDYDGYEYMERVLSNNLTKFSDDIEMMQASADEYTAKGVVVEVKPTNEEGLYWLCEVEFNKYKKPKTYTDLTVTNTSDLMR